MDILKVEITKIENEVLKLSIREQLKAAYESSDDDLEYVREEFSTFCNPLMSLIVKIFFT